VAGLIASRVTAEGAVRTAKAAVGVSENVLTKSAKVTGWLAKKSGKLLAVDSVSLEGRLGSYLRGSRVTFRCRHRLMGKPHTTTISAGAGDFKSGRIFKTLWAAVKEAL
jgi:hypothetical protein